MILQRHPASHCRSLTAHALFDLPRMTVSTSSISGPIIPSTPERHHGAHHQKMQRSNFGASNALNPSVISNSTGRNEQRLTGLGENLGQDLRPSSYWLGRTAPVAHSRVSLTRRAPPGQPFFTLTFFDRRLFLLKEVNVTPVSNFYPTVAMKR